MKESVHRTVIILFMFLLVSCGNNDYIPKPRGYFRISLPEKEYRLFDSVFPYCFEYPVYTLIEKDKSINSEPYWMNVDFPLFNGVLHISYKKVDHNLYQYFEDARIFVNKHIPKADQIETVNIANDSNRVYGILYDISGSGVASTCQFCVTDSINHFIRGALYFNVIPNNDSLSPVIDFVKEDIYHLVETIRWKD
jgi:gliding motility-associated lipoprotein GldD